MLIFRPCSPTICTRHAVHPSSLVRASTSSIPRPGHPAIVADHRCGPLPADRRQIFRLAASTPGALGAKIDTPSLTVGDKTKIGYFGRSPELSPQAAARAQTVIEIPAACSVPMVRKQQRHRLSPARPSSSPGKRQVTCPASPRSLRPQQHRHRPLTGWPIEKDHRAAIPERQRQSTPLRGSHPARTTAAR